MKLNLNSSPFPFLLVLEWILLGIVAIAQLFVVAYKGVDIPAFANCLGIGIFVWMGMASTTSNLVYLGLEFLLILIMTFAWHIPLFQLLFIVLVIRNCINLEGRTRSVITGLAFITVAIGQAQRVFNQGLLLKVPTDQIGTFWIGFILMFGLIVVFLQLLVNTMVSERKSRKQLEFANNQLREYALKVEELATVQERNRIAREIHDALGHSLTGFNLYLEAALKLLHSHPQEAQELIFEAKNLGSEALREVRQSVSTLRINPLEGRSLIQSIGHLVHEFERASGISVISNVCDDYAIANDIKVAIYRITQEALTNISKYSCALEVKIGLRYQSDLELKIEDNGKGFIQNQNTTGFGLQGMKERTQTLNGRIEIVSSLGTGCQIIVHFPIDRNTKNDSNSSS